MKQRVLAPCDYKVRVKLDERGLNPCLNAWISCYEIWFGRSGLGVLACIAARARCLP